jgi:outer membrane protein
MRKVSLAVAAVVLLLLPSALIAQTQNIVFVNLQKVMLESEKGKEAKNAMTGEFEKVKKDLENKQSELQKMKDTIEKQGTTITPEARAEKEKQYQAKMKDYQRIYNDYQTELQQKDSEFTQKILKELEEVVKTIGERDKHTIILEKSQALFLSPSIDITNKVINLYNETAKKKTNKK